MKATAVASVDEEVEGKKIIFSLVSFVKIN
jgi:hypothetical protein